ncbi:MAG: hypothetical protein ACI4WY_04170 [Anaerovoracaceae bacterium]
MKKWITLLLMIAMLCTMAVPAWAAEEEDVLVISPGPEVISPAAGGFSGQSTLQIDGKNTTIQAVTMVPLTKTAKALGFTVKKSKKNGVLKVRLDNGMMHTTLTMGVDRYQAVTSIKDAVGATGPFSLGMAPCVSGGVMYAPLEIFYVLMGCVDGSYTVNGNTIVIHTGSGEQGQQISNPMISFDTMKEAEKAVGFTMTLPASFRKNVQYTVIGGELLEVLQNADGKEICIRKAHGKEDISGIFTEFKNTMTGKKGTADVVLKGDGSRFTVANWCENGYTYAVSTSVPMSQAELMALVSEVA